MALSDGLEVLGTHEALLKMTSTLLSSPVENTEAGDDWEFKVENILDVMEGEFCSPGQSDTR